MLHDVLSVSQSRFPHGYPVAFSTIHLMYVVNDYISPSIVFHRNALSRPHASTLYHHHRIEAFVAVYYPYSNPHMLIHMIRHPDPALSIGFEIVSLPDQAAQI
jgi:hypothetical protein